MSNQFRGVRFDSGRPCKKCGSTEKYFNDTFKRCVPCRVANARLESLAQTRNRRVKKQIKLQESW